MTPAESGNPAPLDKVLTPREDSEEAILDPEEEAISTDIIEEPGEEAPSTGADKTVPVPQAKLSPLAGSSLNLKKLEKDFLLRQQEKEETQLSLDQVLEAWQQYALEVESPSLRQFLQAASVQLNGDRLHVFVGTQMAKGMIQQDTALMHNLRSTLNHPHLGMFIEVDQNLAPIREEEATGPTSPREIFEHLSAKNPLLHELRKRFDLSVE